MLFSLSVLLASVSRQQQQQELPPPMTTTTTTTQQIINDNNNNNNNLRRLTTEFQSLYRKLESPSIRHYNASATLRFDHVLESTTNSHHHWDSGTSAGLKNGNSNKPLAVYLPGLDGYGISAQQFQFADLAATFDFWKLHVSSNDRSPFREITQNIAEFCRKLKLAHPNQKITLIGESCGGLLAAAVALMIRNEDVLQGLVLVNPATSFEETSLDQFLVPALTSLPTITINEEERKNTINTASPYGVLGSLILASIIPDTVQTRRIVDLVWDAVSTNENIRNQPQEVLDTLLETFRVTEERLPASLLEHRVQKWLTVGAPVVNARLSKLSSLPVLVIAGRNDHLLPSAQEARRIAGILPHAETLVVPDRGHFVLDDTVNLTEAILYSKIDPLNKNKKSYDSITDWKIPHDIHEYIQTNVQPFRGIFSPVYVSTDQNGKRWMGMSKIPRPSQAESKKPILFVGNHQFMAADMRLWVADLYEQRGIFARGLAHPVTFLAPTSSRKTRAELGWRTPGLVQRKNQPQTTPIAPADPMEFEKFGAVLVSPRNYYRLMESGQDVLLFPGGAKEALNGNKSYPLYWPDKVDFVRTAAKFNATIVPVAGE
jgi:pimeloyl-ACP methyl ester carboxylesterase